MRTPRTFSIALVALLILAGTSDAETRSWHDHSWSFEESVTWEWLDVAEPTSLKPARLTAEDVAVRELIEAALAEHGLRRELEDDVDLYLAYELVPPKRSRPQPRPGRRPDGFTMGIELPNLGTGRSDNMLYVEIRDAFRNQPVWRGWCQPIARKTIEASDIESAVAKIFELYPPSD